MSRHDDPAWVPARDPMIVACDLSAFTGEPGTCRWCAKPLPLKKDGGVAGNRRWCSEPCTRAFFPLHDWQEARAAALRRDGWACQVCGVIGWEQVPDAVLGNTKRMPPVWPAPRLTGGQGAELFRRELWAYHRQKRESERPQGSHVLEVNHIEPRRGEGYTTGCWNHLDNLQVLCRACHGKVTGAQRRARARGDDDRIDAARLVAAQQTTLRL